MALATLRIVTNDPFSPKDIALSSTIGNQAQTAECDPGFIGDDVTIAAGQHTAHTLAIANAAALAAAEAGLDCVADTEDPGTPVVEWNPYDVPGQGAFNGFFEDIAVFGDLVAIGCTSVFNTVTNPLYAFGANTATLRRNYTATGVPLDGAGSNEWNRIAYQSDGKLLTAFRIADGNNGVKRFNEDGSADGSFALTWNQFKGPPSVLHVQSDDRIIVACDNQDNFARVQRFLADGSNDPSFTTPNLNGLGPVFFYRAAVDSTGRIYLVGDMDSSILGVRSLALRFLANGTLDTGFILQSPGAGFQRATSIVIDGSDVITIGGRFSSVNGTTRNNMARVNTSGTVDGAFNPNVNGGVSAISLQSDGKIVMGGGGWNTVNLNFTTVGGVTVGTNLARLNTDGSLDGAFDHSLNFTSGVDALVVHTTGKIYMVGGFTDVQVGRIRAARVNADGTLA